MSTWFSLYNTIYFLSLLSLVCWVILLDFSSGLMSTIRIQRVTIILIILFFCQVFYSPLLLGNPFSLMLLCLLPSAVLLYLSFCNWHSWYKNNTISSLYLEYKRQAATNITLLLKNSVRQQALMPRSPSYIGRSEPN